MNITISDFNGSSIAEVTSDAIIINNAQEALELFMNCSYQGAEKIVIHEANIIPAFFDLKTGIAGDILQKVSTYRVQLAIVGDFGKFSSKSLADFIFESNKTGRVNFVGSVPEAQQALSRKA